MHFKSHDVVSCYTPKYSTKPPIETLAAIMALSKGPLSRAEKTVRASHVLQRSDCVAAIDFGTSSLSVAYTTPVIRDIKVLPLYSRYERVPNAILITVDRANNEYTTMEVGHRAQNLYSDLKENAKNFIYFERIKG